MSSVSRGPANQAVYFLNIFIHEPLENVQEV